MTKVLNMKLTKEKAEKHLKTFRAVMRGDAVDGEDLDLAQNASIELLKDCIKTL